MVSPTRVRLGLGLGSGLGLRLGLGSGLGLGFLRLFFGVERRIRRMAGNIVGLRVEVGVWG